MAVEEFVQPGKAAAFAFEDQVGVVQCVAVHQQIGLGLGGYALEPVALRLRPGLACWGLGQQVLQGVVHALGIGHQRVSYGGLADVAHDARGNVLVAELAPGAGQTHLGKAGLVQRQHQFLELLAREVARAGQHGDEGGQLVAVAFDEVFECLQIVFGLAGAAIAALYVVQRVWVVGHKHRLAAALALAVQHFAQAGVLHKPGGHLIHRQAAQLLDEGVGAHASLGFKVLRGLRVQVALFDLQLSQELFAHQLARSAVCCCHHFLLQLRKADVGVDHHRAHGGELAYGFKDAHGVKHAKAVFGIAIKVAQARGTAQHLVKQNAAVHLAQENQVANFGHVDAGGEQIHRHGHVGQALVFKAANQLQRLVGVAGDLDDGVVFHAAILGLKGGLEQVHHQIGMAGVDAKDQRFSFAAGVYLLRQVVANGLVEWAGDDLAVEVFHIQVDVVWRLEQFDLVAPGVIDLEVFAHLPVHAVLRQLGVDLYGRLVVH